MRKFILLVLLIHQIFLVSAQRLKGVYTFFDDNWKKIADADKSKYFTRLRNINDTSWLLDTYNVSGPMIRTETVNDKTARIKNGRYASYHPTGYIDSIGQFYNNKAHGNWYYCNDAGKYLFQKMYENGVLISTIDLVSKEAKRKTDSANNNQLTIEEKESEFKGGRQAWSMYLMKNLRYPPDAVNARITGDVVVMFIIDTEGKPKELNLYKSVQVLLDAEAMRLIAVSLKWVPAEQQGKKVMTFKRQTISFRLE